MTPTMDALLYTAMLLLLAHAWLSDLIWAERPIARPVARIKAACAALLLVCLMGGGCGLRTSPYAASGGVPPSGETERGDRAGRPSGETDDHRRRAVVAGRGAPGDRRLVLAGRLAGHCQDQAALPGGSLGRPGSASPRRRMSCPALRGGPTGTARSPDRPAPAGTARHGCRDARAGSAARIMVALGGARRVSSRRPGTGTDRSASPETLAGAVAAAGVPEASDPGHTPAGVDESGPRERS